jgi:hypothetical protein
MSGFNDFMSVNYASFNALTSAYDQTKMFTSVGKLVSMSISSVQQNAGFDATVNFAARSLASDYVVGDLVDVVVFNADKEEGVQKMGIAATTTTTSVTIPATWEAGDQTYVFLSCRRADGTAVSTSDSFSSVIQ